MKTADSILNIGLIQQKCYADRQQSLAVSLQAIRSAAQQGAQLILLPELHSNLYFCQTEDVKNFALAEAIPGPSSEILSQIAQELSIVLVASLFERRAAGLYHNTAVVFEKDGRIAGRYRKMHIPDDPGYYEKFYFTPGDLGFTPINTSVGRLGILVCWDQWFPEAARLMALAGADLLLYPTAIGWDPHDPSEEKQRQCDAWTTMQRGHAIANGIPVAVCNRMGFEAVTGSADTGIEFWGNSFIAGPQGEWLAQAEHVYNTNSHIVLGTIDKARSEQVRRMWPYLRDRRIEAYSGLLQRFLD